MQKVATAALLDAHAETTAEREKRVMRKISVRILPFIMVLFVCSYLDRINIGFAAIAMNSDLKLTAAMFGFANSIFYLGYILCEVPSNIIMQRVGARIWIARIMVTWGLLSAATLFAKGPISLYLIRFLVGVAEGGFLPGILLFITYYFPSAYRARANTLFLLGMPITFALGSIVSSYILSVGRMYGLAAWQWLFVLEGIPSVILGIIAFLYFRDRPGLCQWLTWDEKALIADMFARDHASQAVHNGGGNKVRAVFAELKSPLVLRFAFCYLCLVVSLNTLSTWSPLIIRGLFVSQAVQQIGFVTALPSVCAVIAMLFWGFHSDRTRERKWHIVCPMLLGAIGWLVAALVHVPVAELLGIVLASVGGFATFGVFWTVPANTLSENARPAGLALIATVGLVGSMVSPTIVGVLRDWTHDYAIGLIFAAVMLVLGGVAMLAGRSERDMRVTRQG
jgi:ACS family 4-hydroxyphenylacetate permease-like MFS transporter